MQYSIQARSPYPTPWSVGTRRRPSEPRGPCSRWPAGGPGAGRSWSAAFGATDSARSSSCPSGTADPSAAAPLPGVKLVKGTVPRDFRLQVFFMYQFPQAPEYTIRVKFF